MTKQILIQLFIGIFFLFFSCPSSWTQSKVMNGKDFGNQFIGMKYRGNKSHPYNFKPIKEYSLDSVNGNAYSLIILRRGDTTMAWFIGQFQNQENLKGTTEIIDVLMLPQIKKNQVLILGTCFDKGESEFDREIIAIGNDSGTSEVKKVRRAWRANCETRKFESISVEGLRGINEDRISN